MSRPVEEAAPSETATRLQTILTLLRAAREHAHRVEADDELAKDELLDGVAMAELSALRILDDEIAR